MSQFTNLENDVNVLNVIIHFREQNRSSESVEEARLVAEACPLACKKETIDTDISFTLMSEESARRAFRMWRMPANRTKDDVVFMELFFKTLDTEVCSYLVKEWGDFFASFRLPNSNHLQ